MKSKIAQCLMNVADQINCPQCQCECETVLNPVQELTNIATQFNQIIVTENNEIICMLKQALADEICAAYQYWTAQHMTRGSGKVDVDPEFKTHAYEEWQHADQLIKRIKQLGGFPYMDLKEVFSVCKSHAACGSQSHNVCQLLSITIQAQKDAITCYKKIIAATSNVDPTTHKLAKSILEDQEQHLYDLQMLKEDICQ